MYHKECCSIFNELGSFVLSYKQRIHIKPIEMTKNCILFGENGKELKTFVFLFKENSHQGAHINY